LRVAIAAISLVAGYAATVPRRLPRHARGELARSAADRQAARMRCEVLLYDGFDELDALAPWEVLSRLAGARDDVDAALVSLDGAAAVRAAYGTRVEPHRALAERVDLLVVPGGGWNSRAVQGAWAESRRGEVPAAIRTRHEGGALVASVCTGAMLLAVAGLLDGRPAVTHHGAIDDLRAAGARIVGARVVDDGDIVTAGGVTSGLDLALHLVERYFGAEAALAAERELEYERRGTVWRARARLPTG
jgi:transcriptional regulator GlxA family with amidase domain